MNLSMDALRALVQGADHAEVIGEPRVRLAHILGLGALGVATVGVGMTAAWKAGATHQPEPLQVVMRDADDRTLPPTQPYRLEITQAHGGAVVTSVVIDPAQWAPIEQTAFLLKLARQADDRAQTQGHSLVLAVHADDAHIQAEAQAFVESTLQMSGLPVLAPLSETSRIEAIGLHVQPAAVPRPTLGQALGAVAPTAAATGPASRRRLR